MAQQEEGWPLGLNLRAGMVRNRDPNGSISFNTLLTGSISSSDSSSDLDTESTGSFFHDKSITLGSLIGVSSLLELSRRSGRGRASEPARTKKSYKTKPWFLSLCSRLTTDAVSINTAAPSLGHFLEAERRAAESCRRSPTPNTYGPDDFSRPNSSNSLFVAGQVAPPHTAAAPPPSPPPDTTGEMVLSRDLLIHENGDDPPLILSCLCGNLTY
ncbi:uncharacterized protein At3g17950-like [Andrographis paniculata]|uniref:uncharacterized protein At3g17950-like n=1 Tax=Andrographis paniculata TaxID=175694 RepID=UPI0021E796B2|nr:uncharacterized protein At3g17950-like [Andrographis paniculata]XP_051130565.1 uncharacterized protein At3g17950-like [Andrographis paniculata]